MYRFKKKISGGKFSGMETVELFADPGELGIIDQLPKPITVASNQIF